jgi:hypothetical protein
MQNDYYLGGSEMIKYYYRCIESLNEDYPIRIESWYIESETKCFYIFRRSSSNEKKRIAKQRNRKYFYETEQGAIIDFINRKKAQIRLANILIHNANYYIKEAEKLMQGV